MISTGNPSGQLGNQIFQYCIARILAEELGSGLESFPLREFPLCMHFGQVEGERRQINFRDKNGFRPWGEIFNEAEEWNGISVVGAAPQNIDYLKPYQGRIQHWLGFDEPREPIDEVLVHVRLRDYINLQWAMTPEYYVMILKRLLPTLKVGTKVRIISDELGHPMLDAFKQFEAEKLDISAKDAIDRLARSAWVIMPQSTFSFWPLWLSQNLRQAWMPLPNNSVWSPHLRYDKHGTRFDFVNLFDPKVFTAVNGAETIRERPEQLWGGAF